MTKGFQPDSDELKIQAAVKRLSPSAKRGDLHAFCDAMESLKSRHGGDVVDEAMRRILEYYPDLLAKVPELLPPDMQQELYAKSVELMAEVIEEAGLKLEDHLRVTDAGIGLTKDAVKAIAATGYPGVYQFGEGNESLEGMGIDRSNGFVHPLSEVWDKGDHGLPEKTMNLWAAVSTFISGAQGWLEADRNACLDMLRDCVSRSAPTADVDILLRRSRYDDRVLLKLYNLAHAGLDAKARAAL